MVPLGGNRGRSRSGRVGDDQFRKLRRVPHFPSADIPGQARALFLISPCHFGERNDYEPIQVIPEQGARSGQPFDLGRYRLHSLLPMQRLYQKYFGVIGFAFQTKICRNRQVLSDAFQAGGETGAEFEVHPGTGSR